MNVETYHIEINTRGNCDLIDITDSVRNTVAESGLESGTVTAFIPGSTAAITTIENTAMYFQTCYVCKM